MILDLRTLGELPAKVELEGDAQLLKLEMPDVEAVGILQVHLDVISGDSIYYCRGDVACDMKMECSRCLGSYTIRLDGELDFTILKAGEPGRGKGRRRRDEAEAGERPENLVTAMITEFEIDIDGPICEALSLEIPLKPLCDKNCLGLCPQCGVDRNRTECECKHEEVDPRWDDLRKLGNSNQA